MPAGHDEDAVKLLPVAAVNDAVSAAASAAATAAAAGAMHMKQLRRARRRPSNPWLSICEHCNCWQLHHRQTSSSYAYAFMASGAQARASSEYRCIPAERAVSLDSQSGCQIGAQLLLFDVPFFFVSLPI